MGRNVVKDAVGGLVAPAQGPFRKDHPLPRCCPDTSTYNSRAFLGPVRAADGAPPPPPRASFQGLLHGGTEPCLLPQA